MRVVFWLLWAIELARVMKKIPHFGIGIIWGAIPMSFPVFWIGVSGRSLNSYGTSPTLWDQKKLVNFWQGTQDTWLRFAKFLREFLGYPPLNLLGDLGDVILGYLRVKNILSSTAYTAFRRFSWNCCQFLLASQCSHTFRGKILSVAKTEFILFLVIIKVSSRSEGIKFQQYKHSKKLVVKRVTILKVAIFYKKVQYRTATIYIITIVLLVLLFIPFLGGKQNCLHARSRYK